VFAGRFFQQAAVRFYKSRARSLRRVIPEIDIWRAADPDPEY